MIIEMKYEDGKVTIGARDEQCGLVSIAEGPTAGEAAKTLVSRFAEMQKQTIEALNASGLIRYVPEERLS